MAVALVIALIIAFAFFVCVIVAASAGNAPIDRAEEDEEQIKYVEEWIQKRKKNS